MGLQAHPIPEHRAKVSPRFFLALVGLLCAVLLSSSREGVMAEGKAVQFRGVNGALQLTEEDISHLAQDWRANSLRILLSHGRAIQTKPPYEYVEEDLKQLDAIVGWCEKFGVNCIINIHEAPGYVYVSGQDNSLWTSPEHQERLVRAWEMLARRYRNRSPLVWYDLLNEPHGTDEKPGAVGSWNRLAKELTAAVRKIDPDHTIIVEGTGWAFPRGFGALEPTGDANTVYDFHWYLPKGYSHAKPEDKVTYPGALANWTGGPPSQWDKARMLKELEPVFAFEKKFGVPVRCGEFGVVRWAGGAAQYLKDFVDICEERGYDWNYYSYREWQAMNLEYGPDPNDRTRQETDRLGVLRRYFALDRFAPTHE
jgi:aryl-phospho-beta-D-glucosidase BglC (GH1 family)